jgi:hypothetical protein
MSSPWQLARTSLTDGLLKAASELDRQKKLQRSLPTAAKRVPSHGALEEAHAT